MGACRVVASLCRVKSQPCTEKNLTKQTFVQGVQGVQGFLARTHGKIIFLCLYAYLHQAAFFYFFKILSIHTRVKTLHTLHTLHKVIINKGFFRAGLRFNPAQNGCNPAQRVELRKRRV
jgi:hypothetical protein